MKAEKIPVYDICRLSDDPAANDELLADRLSSYLEQRYRFLHFPHRHSFYHLVLFTRGSGEHTIDFERFNVEPYQVYFMNPGQVHSWHFGNGMEGYIVNFSHTFFSRFLANQAYMEQFSFFSGVSTKQVFQLPVPVRENADSLLSELLTELEQPGHWQMDKVRLLLLRFLILVADQSGDQELRQAAAPKRLLLQGFQKLIEQNYRALKLPKEYADLLYVTPNHLNALCRDLVGKTAGELIRDRILLEAKRLLTNAGMSISQIAHDLRFEDNSYFNRFFRKYVGVTPDEFRKQFIA